MTKLALLIAAAAMLALAAGATTTSATSTQVRKLTANPSGALRFDRTRLSAHRGIVELTMANPSALQHGIAIQGRGVDKQGEIVDQGGTSVVKVRLRRIGRYTFYCPFDGHRAAGMRGTLIVK